MSSINLFRDSSHRQTEYRYGGSLLAVEGKESEYLIVRLDQFGSEKIVTYGINDD